MQWKKFQPGNSPYHTIHPADTNLEGWNFQNLKQHRSNSWSESLDDLKVFQDASYDTLRNMRWLDKIAMILKTFFSKCFSSIYSDNVWIRLKISLQFFILAVK